MMTTGERPLISVIVPTWNGASTAFLAIQSIRAQTYENWEMIVSDDASTDETLKIIERFADPRIHIIRNVNREGISVRLNQAISVCRGEFIARMDIDDVCFPKRFEKQFQFMTENRDIDIVGCSYMIIDDQNIARGTVVLPCSHAAIAARPWGGFPLAHPSWLVRNRYFQKHVYKTLSNKAEDQELLLRTHVSSKFANLPEILVAYRQNEREWKKVYAARKAFFRSFWSYGVERRSLGFLLRLSSIQLVKFVFDVLSMKAKIRYFAPKLNTVSPELEVEWDKVRKRIAEFKI